MSHCVLTTQSLVSLCHYIFDPFTPSILPPHCFLPGHQPSVCEFVGFGLETLLSVHWHWRKNSPEYFSPSSMNTLQWNPLYPNSKLQDLAYKVNTINVQCQSNFLSKILNVCISQITNIKIHFFHSSSCYLSLNNFLRNPFGGAEQRRCPCWRFEFSLFLKHSYSSRKLMSPLELLKRIYASQKLNRTSFVCLIQLPAYFLRCRVRRGSRMEGQSSTLCFSWLLNSASNYREAHIVFHPRCLFISARVKHVALVGLISKCLVPWRWREKHCRGQVFSGVFWEAV